MTTDISGNSAQPPDPGAGSGGQLPDDQQALLDDIQRTREQLGETVEALAARADVKARATRKAAEAARRVETTVRSGQEQVADRASQVRDQLARKAGAARQSAGRALLAAQSARESLRPQAAQPGESAWDAAPGPARQAARRAAASIREHRGPCALAAAAVLLTSWLVIRRGRRS
ncbi:MAG: DUF3618 domain-containing protein [Streptosporangiaceae bacterium]